MDMPPPNRVLMAMRWLLVLLPFGLLAGPAVGDVVASLMAIVFLGYCGVTKQWQWLRTPWVLALLLLWLHFMLIVVWAPDGAGAFKRGLVWIRYPIFMAALVFWIGRDAWVQKRFLQTLLATVLFLAGDTLLQFYTGQDLFGRPITHIDDFIRLSGPYSSLRPGITLVYIGFPALFFLLAMAQKAVRYRMALHLAFVAAAILFVVAVYFSGERMALLLTMFGFVVAPLLVKRYRLFWLGGLVVAAGLLYLITDQHKILRVRQFYYLKYEVLHLSESTYVQIWHSAAKVGAAHPVTGVGLKNFRLVCPEAQYGADNGLRCGSHAHNLYLELFAESGAVGMLFFSGALALWLRACWRQRRLFNDDMILAGLLVTLLIRIWPLAAISSQFNPWAGVPLWLFTGLLLARLRLSDMGRPA